MKLAVVVSFLWTSLAFGQNSIPAGAVLPASLNTSLNSRKSVSGKIITARIMQDVPLADGRRMHTGAKLIGRVISVQPPGTAQAAEITIQFDRIKLGHADIPIRTNLRAMASLRDVEDAQTPTTGPDRGTPSTWITRNLVGGEVAYGDGGPVARGTDIVGTALADGILVPVAANPRAGCRGEIFDNHHEQALWVFSSDACGIYGYPDVHIAQSGRAEPLGTIRFTSARDFVIRSGTGMLLRVN